MHREADPDAAWVAALAGVSESRARAALEQAGREEAVFRHLAREHRAGGRAGYVEIDAPLELYALVRLRRPRHCVEVGVSSGVSSAYLLAALARNRAGQLHSVDLPQFDRGGGPIRPAARTSWSVPPGRRPGWAVPRRLRDRWELWLGDKSELLPPLARSLPAIDLFVYDVPHRDARVHPEFRAVDRRMAPGAIAIVDHGPGGELCPALDRWARRRHARPVGRSGLGLYGFRCGATGRSPPARSR